MKVGILTFHAAHNYGSMLQNYALQHILKELGYEPETINLRTSIQKELYDFFMPSWRMRDKKHIVRKLMFYPWKKSLEEKKKKFEDFLYKEIQLSPEVGEYKDIKKLPLYDAYIIGSDQCWNIDADDFDWSYFLDFVPNGVTRLSYAISMGPDPYASLDAHKQLAGKIACELEKFKGVSVRDGDTKSIVEQVTNSRVKAEIHVDPTLLLTKEDWEKRMNHEKIVQEPYIFFYNPYWIDDVFEQANELGKITGLRVVVSLPNVIGLVRYPQFKNVFAVGPWEFLNLVKNATYVVGRSFHLIAFSIIFQKKFIAIDGMGDSRIRQLLIATNLEQCASHAGSLKEVVSRIEEIDFSESFSWLNAEYIRSTTWLKDKLK